MLEVTFAGWAATVGLIAALFLLDLFVTRPGHAHTVGFREAVVASVFYVGVAVAFGVIFGLIAGWDYGAEYFAGYVVEKSLSVDNLFVFVVIMATFAVPPEHQQRVLTFGILAALVMRAIFIALGAALISAFSFMFLISGCCSSSRPSSCSATATRTPRSKTTRWFASPAACCRSPTPTPAAG
jgi:tellurite resistance protein TerC